MDKVVESYIKEILQTVLVIPNDDIWIASQDKKIFKDNHLYYVISNVSTQTVACNSYFDYVNETNIVQSTAKEIVQIDLFSKGNLARDQRYRTILALKSFYSQEIQNRYGFAIFRIPNSFLNTTSLEGGSMLNRYTIRIPCYVWHKEIFEARVYETFSKSIIYD